MGFLPRVCSFPEHRRGVIASIVLLMEGTEAEEEEDINIQEPPPLTVLYCHPNKR
jgi:hypothetical protein